MHVCVALFCGVKQNGKTYEIEGFLFASTEMEGQTQCFMAHPIRYINGLNPG